MNESIIHKLKRNKFLNVVKRFVDRCITRLRSLKYVLKRNDDSQIKYCIIRIDRKVGWFGYWNDLIIPGISYCEKNRYIPIIDFWTSKYSNGFRKTKKNVWELFYKQQGNIKLSDRHWKSNVIFVPNPYKKPQESIRPVNILYDNKCLDEYCRLCEKYLVLEDKLRVIVDEAFDTMLKETQGSNLAVSLRGTDYLVSPHGHPVQAGLSEVFVVIDNKIQEWSIKKIYISTEDQSIYDKMHEKYGGMIVAWDDMRGDIRHTRASFFDLENIQNYIISKTLVAKCDYLIGGITGGTIAAIGINNNRYADKYIFDLGSYK